MKKLIILSIIFLCFGCARIQIGDASYMRFGGQTISLTIEKPDGTKILFNQDAQAQALLEAIKKIGL